MSWPMSIIGSGRAGASRSGRLIASLIVSVVVAIGSAVVTVPLFRASFQDRFQDATTVVREPGTIAGTDARTELLMPAVGVDSYSYHRLLGETRRGETPPLHVFAR